MGVFDKIIGGGISELVKGFDTIVGRFKESPQEQEAARQHYKMLVKDVFITMENNITREQEAKERVMIAEMNQSDNYTKRARPTTVYSGIALGFMEMFGLRLLVLSNLPVSDMMRDNIIAQSGDIVTMYLGVWAGVVAVYSIGRSAEKRGQANKMISAITGSKG